MRRLLALFVGVVAASAHAAGVSRAADVWHATQVAGEVRVEIGNAPAVPLTVAMAIEHEALIETAASGSATLERGEEHLTVAPNSRLRLPVDDGSGLTRVIEEFGHLFFQVGKKTTPHFRVETPLLAATVKGTSFAVSVDNKGANVEVSEGLVMVQNNASADVTYVAAGRTANVSNTEPMTIYLDHAAVPPSNLRLGDAGEHLGLTGPAQSSLPSTAGAVERITDHRQRMPTTTSPAPQIAFTNTGTREPRHSGTGAVIDSTLSGIGVGILGAALAIIFIGTTRRPPGVVATKATREAPGEQSHS